MDANIRLLLFIIIFFVIIHLKNQTAIYDVSDSHLCLKSNKKITLLIILGIFGMIRDIKRIWKNKKMKYKWRTLKHY